MEIRKTKILITGGAGFMGSEFTRELAKRDCQGVIVDKLTYAGDLKRLSELNGRYKFYKVDICDKEGIGAVFKKEGPEVILNFSAETHVDRSIFDSAVFIETNIKGTQILLDISRKHKVKRFIHISTDEVYGEIKKGKFNEDAPLRPNNPYAASKAAADLLIRTYIRTYGFPAIIIRPCNNYGLWQYPEKLIPLAILKIIKNQKVSLYGNGKNIREWLYLEDCIEGILKIVELGEIGEIYNLGSNEEKENIDVVKEILKLLGKSEKLIQFIKDRPGHDYRYSLDITKIKKLGWSAKIDFKKGIEKTVRWYLKNLDWLTSRATKINNKDSLLKEY